MTRFNNGESLTKTLAPAAWEDVLGQPAAVSRLSKFALNPYAGAFLFRGATGTGKNCTARVLAGALGCTITGNMIERQMSGYFDLCAASLTPEEAMARIRGASYRALNPRGWKCIVISEADKLKEGKDPFCALNLFLHVLDDLPPSTVWVFTSNYPEDMDRRFHTRCEPVCFESDVRVLQDEANKWLAKLWKEAGRNHKAPTVADFPLAVMGGHLSYRALVLGLQSKLATEGK